MLSIVALVGLSSSLFGDFKIIAGWDQQLFPSYIIATATIKDESKATDENLLGDRNGLLGIELVAPNDQTPIEITIAGNEFIESSTLVSRLPKKGVSYRVFPKIKYRYQQLSDCKQARAESFTFRVKIGDQKAEEKSSTITIHPIHDCPLAVLDGDSVVDVAFTFAAYVNEQHPFVDKLLREALDIGVVDKFTGYQSNDPEEVIRQVYALWDLFVARMFAIAALRRRHPTPINWHANMFDSSRTRSTINKPIASMDRFYWYRCFERSVLTPFWSLSQDIAMPASILIGSQRGHRNRFGSCR